MYYWRCLDCVTPRQLSNVLAHPQCGSLENVDLFDELSKEDQTRFVMAFQSIKTAENSPKTTKSTKSTTAKKVPKIGKATKKSKAKTKAKTTKKKKNLKAPSSWKEKVIDAIATMKECSGSSLPAIKKYLGAMPKQWRYIRATLKTGVANGTFKKNGGKYKLQQ
jgi:hypothetical protein